MRDTDIIYSIHIASEADSMCDMGEDERRGKGRRKETCVGNTTTSRVADTGSTLYRICTISLPILSAAKHKRIT